MFIATNDNTAVAIWYNSNWNFRRTMTIESDLISAGITNFPLLIVINSTISTKTNANGSDLLFTSMDNSTIFNYEIEGDWDNSGTNYVWLNISETIPASPDYQFFLYYNNTNAPDIQNITGTWDSNFVVVQHLNESSGQHLDSTSNDNDSTEVNVFKQGNATGISNGCDDFEASALDNVTMPSLGDLNTFTVEFWMKPESLTADMEMFSKDGKHNSILYTDGHAYFGLEAGDAMSSDAGDVDIGAWYYFVAASDSSQINLILGNVTAGTMTGEDSGTATDNLDGNYAIGYRLGLASHFDGLIDEFRISNTRRSDAWINATFHSQNQTDGFLTFGLELTEGDDTIDPPTSFKASTINITEINVTWVIGTNATHTHIRRNLDSAPADRTEGTLIYNDTGTFYADTSLTRNNHYYYRAWSFNSTSGNFSTLMSTANNITGPGDPTNIATTIDTTNLTINITWTKGLNAETTRIQRKASTFPTGPADGTNVYNDTGTWNVTSVSTTETYRFKAFAFDTLTGLFSAGVEIPYGALIVNCYDEETNESIDFDILVNNEDGTETYESLDNSNPLVIDVDDLPLGDNIRIQISATSSVINKTQTFTGYSSNENASITQVVLLQDPNSKSSTNITTRNATAGTDDYPQFIIDEDIISIPADASVEFSQITVNYTHDEYESRTYFRDFAADQVFILNAYLPNADDSELYRITVEDAIGLTVNDALVDMKVSVDGVFVTASSLLTDGNGNADVFLLPGTTYLFSISKTRYVTTYGTWTPSTAVFVKTFKISVEDEVIVTETFGDLIIFTGEWVTANNSLMVVFTDKNESTTDVTFSVYESYGTNLTLTNRTTFGATTTATIYFNTLNTSRMHQIRLEMNHTTLGHILNQTIYVSPIREDDKASETWLETIITAVMGDFDYGYVVFALIYGPCIVLIITLGAVKQPGFGVFCSGLYIILVTWRIEMANTFIISIASLFILFGVIMIIVKHGKKLTGRR